MPQLNGKKYAYTKKGKEQYKKDKKKKYTLSSAKKKLASMGRRGDTELEHVNKDEQRILKAMGASRTKNPRTGLTENSWISSAIKRNTGGNTPKPKVTVPTIKVNVPKSTGDVVKGIKDKLPKGLDYQNVGKKMLETANAAEKFVGGGVTDIYRAGAGTVAQILTGTNPFTQSSDSGSGSGTTTFSGSGGESGFGGMKRRKKKKKPGEAEGDSQGQNTKGGKMSKRGLRTPKRTGLNIVKKNSSSTSLGM